MENEGSSVNGAKLTIQLRKSKYVAFFIDFNSFF